MTQFINYKNNNKLLFTPKLRQKEPSTGYEVTSSKVFTFSILFFLIGIVSCKKFVEVPPPVNSVTAGSVFSSNSLASSAVNGMFESMAVGSVMTGGNPGITSLLGLSSDELFLFTSTSILNARTFSNSLISTTPPSVVWNNLYSHIYQANTIIAGVFNSTTISDSLKKQFMGEAKFVRAFCHFYLVNLYGDVPLVLTSDYTINAGIARSPKSAVYSQIILDLKDAQSLLSINYRMPNGTNATDRVRPNIGAATALLSRVYLYIGDWANAELQASSVITNTVGTYSLVNFPSSAFVKGSPETIWQLERPNTGGNTSDASVFLPLAYGGSSATPFAFLSDSLVNSFESGDLRKANWTVNTTISGKAYFSPYKYRLNSTPGIAPGEYPILLRLAEQYLIRAEARAQLNNLNGAISDINVIRTRAGLPNLSSSLNQTQILSAVAQERRIELFTEWGHRWLDLKRTGKADAVMSIICPLKGGIWNTNWLLYPIALTEIQRDPNLVQNPGY